MHLHIIQHVPYESPGSLIEWAGLRKLSISQSALYASDMLPPPDAIDWLVLMGGPMGVYDEAAYPWLSREKEFIRQVILHNKKLLGICLGAQLLAEALGARVYRLPEKEIGWFPIENIAQTKDGDSLFHTLPNQFVGFHWHGDSFDLPEGAVWGCRSQACAHQAFAVNRQCVGIQFHPEVTPQLVQAMAENGLNELTKGAWVQGEEEILAENRFYERNKVDFWNLLDELASR